MEQNVRLECFLTYNRFSIG